MKRSLIDYDVLKKMENRSLSSAQFELEEATDLLSEALEVDFLELHCYGDESVLYETLDGAFIHANYKVDDGNLTFENVQELVVDEDTEKAETKRILGDLLDNILEDDDAKATKAFEQYLTLPNIRRELLEGNTVEEEELNEGAFTIRRSKPTKRGPGRGKKQPRWLVNKRTRERGKTLRRLSPSLKKRAKRERDKMRRGLPKRKNARPVLRYGKKDKMSAHYMQTEHCNAVSHLVEGVSDFLNYKELGPVLKNLLVKHDDKGNVIALRIPTTEARNQSRMLSFKWNVLDHECKIMRGASKNLGENQDFCKAVAELKRSNALSDNDAMTENLEAIASNWPDVIYLTHAELSEVVSTALKTAGVTNWDDEVSTFLSEGILRKIHSSYTDRVDKILKLAGVEIKEEEGAFEKFQEVVHKFYPSLDESVANEMQVFVDLYNSVRDIHEVASKAGDEIVAEEATGYLRDLYAVVSQDVESDLTLAEEVTLWLGLLIETNLETQTWNVNNKPHMTVSGDHPDMAKKAGQGYSPRADATGDWGDEAPVSDGKNYKGGLADEMRNRSWGNVGGSDVYPSVQNPYTPQPFGDYTMKGEKGVDKENTGFSLYRGQTWPELQNPYTPDAPGQDGWRMKADNLVIDK
tara:strand:+ start:1138 stop:3045 length:1908 start_codon:yes stop_codon:yes gene_type:complete